MRLHRLTGLEQDKIVAEYRELLERVLDLSEILALPARLTAVVRAELVEIRDNYGDARRTEISRDHLNLSTEDLIEPQDVVVTLSHAGYAKAQPVSDYQAQRRGGRGKSATAVRDEDFIEKFFIAHTHDTLLCFSAGGARFARQADREPAAARRGREDQCTVASQAIRRAAFRFHGDQPRHGQEDTAGGVFATACIGHHRGRPQ
jgi:DNA gyrase subunit A